MAQDRSRRRGNRPQPPLVAFDFDGTLTTKDSFTAFLRWRADKRPDQCTRDQLEHELSPAALEQVFESA